MGWCPIIVGPQRWCVLISSSGENVPRNLVLTLFHVFDNFKDISGVYVGHLFFLRGGGGALSYHFNFNLKLFYDTLRSLITNIQSVYLTIHL